MYLPIVNMHKKFKYSKKTAVYSDFFQKTPNKIHKLT